MNRFAIAVSLMTGFGVSLMAGNVASAQDKLVIGAAISKTGWDAPYDSPVMDGFAVAIDEINAKGGIAGKYKVEVVTRDNRSDNAQNAIVTQDLVDQGVNLLLATCDSSMVHATAQIIVSAKIPAISTCSSSPTLPMTGHGYIFANAVTDNVQGAAQAEYANSQGYKNAYLLRSPDIEYTQMPLYFKEAFEKLGGKVIGESIYALNQPDFSAEVTKIKQMSPQPDVIVTSAFEPDFPAFIRQLRGAGVKIPVVCGDGIDSPTTFALGDVVEGVVFTSSGFAAPGSPMAAYQDKYKAKYGKAPESIMDALGYDLAMIIEAAVTKADSVDPQKIRDALADLSDVQGATAVISYKGGNGTPTRPVNVLRIVNNKRTLVSQKAPDPAIIPAPRLDLNAAQ
ncbi:MAG TPA: ABC transporter substrate-binding protein [Candidatus Binatia bacterium]|nr:ABC transporter substrate-binding protein [Candidatus Binatia bacterium]